MSDAEIGALRAKLASRPRSDDYRQRRKDIDAPRLGLWARRRCRGRAGDRERRTSGVDDDSERRPRRRAALPAWRRLCDRLPRQPPPSGRRGRPGCGDRGIGAGLSSGARAPVPGRGRRRARRLPLSAGPGHLTGTRRARRRQRRRRSGGRGDAGDPRRGPAATRLRLVHLALGRHGSDRRDDDEQGRRPIRPCSAPAFSTWRRCI